MGVNLGPLGVEPQAAEDDPTTFNWFGTQIRAISQFNELELVDLMERADSIDVDDIKAAVAVKDMLRLIVNAEDFDTFWTIAKAKNQKLDDLMRVFQVLMEATSGRPTQQPSDSSVGRQATQPSLPGGSSSPASVGRPGRPDLVIIGEDDAATRAKVQEAARAAAMAG